MVENPSISWARSVRLALCRDRENGFPLDWRLLATASTGFLVEQWHFPLFRLANKTPSPCRSDQSWAVSRFEAVALGGRCAGFIRTPWQDRPPLICNRLAVLRSMCLPALGE